MWRGRARSRSDPRARSEARTRGLIATHNDGGATPQALEYERYANGLISARHAAGRGLEEHTYDALNRLDTTTTTPAGGTAEQVTYTYDTLGNITHTGQYAVGYHGTRKHQVTTVGPNSYQYNASGNVRERSGPDIPGGLQTIEYTPFDLPRTITSGDLVTHFEYTADDTRVVRRDIDRTRHFVGDLYQRVISPTGDTLEERFRIQAGGRLIGEIVRADGTERTLYAHTDHQGTVDTLTAGPGEVYTQPYSPWGSPEGSAGLDQTRAGYTGHQHDTDLGLVDMRGRIYDPLAARFMSPDPVMQAPFWSQGLNRYSYVFNDPVNNTDPTGFVTANDWANVYGAFHVPAMTSAAAGTSALGSFIGASSSGLGFLSGPASVGSTLLGGGAGFGQAGGTYNAVPSQAPTGRGGVGQGGTNATGQVGGQVGAATGSAPSGWTSEELVRALHDLHERGVDDIRDKIAAAAEHLLANTPRAMRYSEPYREWGPGTDKCNCLVTYAIQNAGLSASGTLFGRPPTAGELARGSNLPPGFSLVAEGEGAMRGDIVAQARRYPGGATGHTAIMTSSSDLIHATGDVGIMHTTLGRTFPSNHPLARTPVRFVRYGTPNPWVF